MAGGLIIVNQNDTFAIVGDDVVVLRHLSALRLPDGIPAPVRDVGEQLLARLVMMARAPGHPGADVTNSQLGPLEAFDDQGRPVALRTVRGGLGRGATGPVADPEALLRRLGRVITHVNAEAARPNPRRSDADKALILAYQNRGELPLQAPATLNGVVNFLWDRNVDDPPGASERLLRRTPLAPLAPALETTMRTLRPGRSQVPEIPPPDDDPPEFVPHRSGWFHNLWHAATGTS